MNQRKNIDFEECYKRHFPKHNNKEEWSSEGDSELDEEDKLNRPTSLLNQLNDTIEYCTSENQINIGTGAVKKKKKKKKTQEKQSELKQPNGNRFSCLSLEPDGLVETNEKPQTNGIDNCWNSNYASAMKLFPQFPEKPSVEGAVAEVSNNLLEDVTNLKDVQGSNNNESSTEQKMNGFDNLSNQIMIENLFYANTPSSSSGSNLAQSNATVSKKTKKNKNVQQLPTIVGSEKENISKTASKKQAGAVKKNSVASTKVETPLLNIKSNEKKTKKAKLVEKTTLPKIDLNFSVQNFFQSVGFPKKLPVSNGIQSIPPLPPSHWYSEDIHYPIYEPGKPNLGFENFPPLSKPSPDLRLDISNFPPLDLHLNRNKTLPTNPYYFAEEYKGKHLGELDLKTEVLKTTKTKRKRSRGKKVAKVSQVVNDGKPLSTEVKNGSNFTTNFKAHVDTIDTVAVYECAMPENQECKDSINPQNISIDSIESMSHDWIKDKDLNSSLNESVDFAKLNQSFDSELSKSNDSSNNIEFPINEDYTESLAGKFLSGSLTMEQLWYVELGQIKQCLHILDAHEKKPKISKKKKKEVNEVLQSKLPIERMDVKSYKGHNSVPVKDTMNLDYIYMQRNPEELSLTYIYTSENQSLIAFCDDYLSKNDVKPMLDNNTGLVTLKSSPSTN